MSDSDIYRLNLDYF